METTSLADATSRLSELVASVEETGERVLITKAGRPAAVLIAPDDLDSLLETLEVLSDPSATEAIRQAEAGEADLISGDELAASCPGDAAPTHREMRASTDRRRERGHRAQR